MKGYIFGMVKIKTGMMIIKVRTAMVEPRRVSFRAWWPCPFRSSLCPGRTPSAVSSSGAPRNIDGIKSTKV